MNVIQTGNLSKDVIEEIKPIEESILDKLVEKAFLVQPDVEDIFIYDSLYQSQYSVEDLSSQEQEVMNYIHHLASRYPDLIRTNKQHSEYHWVKMNTQESGTIMYRFYLAPAPKNMHEIVRKLIDKCMARKIGVRFKFQQNKNQDNCDRIIIYSDYDNKNAIEYTLAEIFLEDPKLFEHSERPLSWTYSTLVPGVYLAPETPGISYGLKFAQTIINANDVFCYLYGVKEAREVLRRSPKEVAEAKKYMKTVLSSLMFRNGLLLDQQDVPFVWNMVTPHISYKSSTGTLHSSNYIKDKYYDVEFLPTFQGRDVLLKNFYAMPLTKTQPGVKARCITRDERKKEIDKALYQRPIPTMTKK